MAFRGGTVAPSRPYATYVPYPSTSGTPTANLVILLPIWIPKGQGFRGWNLQQSGAIGANIDLGVYSVDLRAIVRTGPLAIPATGRFQRLASAPFYVPPGRNYIAFVKDAGVGAFFGQAGLSSFDWIKVQAATFPLPATVVPTATGTTSFIPTIKLIP